MSYSVRRQLNLSNLYIVGDLKNRAAIRSWIRCPTRRIRRSWTGPRPIATSPPSSPEGAKPPLDAFADIAREMRLVREASKGTTTEALPLPPSAFSAMTLVLGVLKRRPEGWRPSLRKLDASYVKAARDGSVPEHIKVDLAATFASDTVVATSHLRQFQRALEAESWCLDVDAQHRPHQGGRGSPSGMKVRESQALAEAASN